MKQGVVVDEMFPEGAGPYMDIDEVCFIRDLASLSNTEYRPYNLQSVYICESIILNTFRAAAGKYFYGLLDLNIKLTEIRK